MSLYPNNVNDVSEYMFVNCIKNICEDQSGYPLEKGKITFAVDNYKEDRTVQNSSMMENINDGDIKK